MATYTHQFDSPLYKGSVSLNTGLFIDGKFVPSASQKTVDVINPVTGKVITNVSCGDATDIDAAVQAAKKAFKTSWGLKVPGYERGRLLNKLGDLMEKHQDELSAIEALDGGKHFMHAKIMDVAVSIKNIRYFAGWADKNHGQTLETNEAKFAYTRHEPIGVCGAIVPWNFPLMCAIYKIAPALATGNVVIVKPSEFTPLSILKFAELVAEAGFPPGVFSVVVGHGPTAGQALADHPEVRKISFTGSTIVGRKIMEASGKSNLKRVTLELGGKSPLIIFDDADLEQAVKWAAMSIFHHSGQMCAAGSRIFVQEGIYDKFAQYFAGAAQSIRLGDGFDSGTQQGPLVSQVQLERVLNYIEAGKKEGATVIAGGARKGETGYFVQPTIFTNVNSDMKIVKEEIFGPVAVLTKFKTEEEVIDEANNTNYGLSAYVFSQNISRALRVAHSLEAGSASINAGISGDVQVPFGGFKQSGFGKEQGEYALEVYTNVKAVHVNLAMKL